MLEQDVPLDQILQIWFSTSISNEAAKTLHKFCQVLSVTEKDTDVLVLFDYWSSVPFCGTISVEPTIQIWNKGRKEGSIAAIPMLLSKRDRVEYARYLLKGQIFIGGTSEEDLTGNPTF